MLDHPNIVKLVGGNGPTTVEQLKPGKEFYDQDPYVITEWIPNTLDKIGTLPWSDYLTILSIKHYKMFLIFS